MLWGCPTEIWLAASLFWPTLLLLFKRRYSTLALTAIAVSTLLLAFTHEAALLSFPLFLTVALLRCAIDHSAPAPCRSAVARPRLRALARRQMGVSARRRNDAHHGRQRRAFLRLDQWASDPILLNPALFSPSLMSTRKQPRFS